MNQRTEQPLSLDGSWERIVNDTERHNARVHFEETRKRNRIRKRLGYIIDCALSAAAVIALDVAGLLAPVVAMPTAVIFICIACFIAGRVWEQRRK